MCLEIKLLLTESSDIILVFHEMLFSVFNLQQWQIAVLGLSRSSRLLSVSCDKLFLFFSSVIEISHTLDYFSPSPTRGFYSVTTRIQPSAVNRVVEVSSWEPEGWAWFGSLCGAWYQWSRNFLHQQEDCPSGLCCMSHQQPQGLTLSEGPGEGEHGHVLNIVPNWIARWKWYHGSTIAVCDSLWELLNFSFDHLTKLFWVL